MEKYRLGDERIKQYYNAIIPFFEYWFHERPNDNYHACMVPAYPDFVTGDWIINHLNKKFVGWKFKIETMGMYSTIKAYKRSGN